MTTALTWLKSKAGQKWGQVQFVYNTLRAVPANWTRPLLRLVSRPLPPAPFPAVQQTVQEDFRHHDQHAGVGIFAAIAGHQAHVFGLESPADSRRLHFAELLLRQRDQRRGVVGRFAGVQGLEQGRLGNQRFAGAGGRADQHALVGREPGQQRLFLHLVRLVGKLVEIAADQFVTRGEWLRV